MAALLRVTANTFPAIKDSFDWYKGKPIECPICLAGWIAVATTIIWLIGLDLQPKPSLVLLVWLASSGIGAWIADQLRPPEMPE